MDANEGLRSDKLIMIPYGDKQNANTGVNITQNDRRQEIYMKNCCVSACSAKQHNPDCTVAIVTNVEFPTKYIHLLSRHHVQFITVPFDRFCFDDSYTWALAFYKLCALHHVVREHAYRYYAYLDADIYVQSSFADIWRECDQNIMLYDISHGLQVNDYRIFVEEVGAFCNDSRLITHYGGEFFAATRENALQFSACCESVYERMMENGFRTSKGDEFILSLAAADLRAQVKNASAYIYRFWTGTFNLTSTCYQFNPVTILHVPSEKELGFIRIFDRYYGRDRVPHPRAIHRMLHLKKPSLRISVSNKGKQILKYILRR